MTDFRALCAELVSNWDNAVGDPDFCDVAEIMERARAALAQPEPQGPTNERLTWLWNHLQVSRRQLMALRGENCLDDTDYQQFARSVLKQWGRPAIEPVPVAERLPGPEDCDAEGCCWAIGERGNWMCVHVLGRSWSNPVYTHWLPHHALPMPQQEVE
jgi:hypothetical protein